MRTSNDSVLPYTSFSLVWSSSKHSVGPLLCRITSRALTLPQPHDCPEGVVTWSPKVAGHLLVTTQVLWDFSPRRLLTPRVPEPPHRRRGLRNSRTVFKLVPDCTGLSENKLTTEKGEGSVFETRGRGSTVRECSVPDPVVTCLTRPTRGTCPATR